MSDPFPQCLEHSKRLEAIEFSMEETKVVAIRTEQRTIEFISSVKRIEFALAGDSEMQVDGLAKEHKQLKMDVEALKTDGIKRHSWAAGAGAVASAVFLGLAAILKAAWTAFTAVKP